MLANTSHCYLMISYQHFFSASTKKMGKSWFKFIPQENPHIVQLLSMIESAQWLQNPFLNLFPVQRNSLSPHIPAISGFSNFSRALIPAGLMLCNPVDMFLPFTYKNVFLPSLLTTYLHFVVSVTVT